MELDFKVSLGFEGEEGGGGGVEEIFVNKLLGGEKGDSSFD